MPLEVIDVTLVRAALEDSLAIFAEYFPAGCPEFKFKNLAAFGTRVLYMDMEPVLR
jgi:hypothetical protein